jgi:hypothetical protein
MTYVVYAMCKDYEPIADFTHNGIGTCELYFKYEDGQEDDYFHNSHYTVHQVRCRTHPRRQANTYETHWGWARAFDRTHGKTWRQRWDNATQRVVWDRVYPGPNPRSVWVAIQTAAG